MAARVVVEEEALSRLEELGLTLEIIQRSILRAEAEAATCTDFDPPTMAGFTRYGRTVRFLREELVPLGWDYDNPRNLCRTINPSRDFAIVSTSGDEATGDPALNPSTKNPKGYATELAVDRNEQLMFDFGDDSGAVAEIAPDDDQLATWFLLYRATAEEIKAEISLPSEFEGTSIVDWRERIILPTFTIDADVPAKRHGDDEDGTGEYVVEVSRRS
ncbi:hypothetical protein BH09ACT8_BH09ACT8_15570 [soil metagenome]